MKAREISNLWLVSERQKLNSAMVILAALVQSAENVGVNPANAKAVIDTYTLVTKIEKSITDATKKEEPKHEKSKEELRAEKEAEKREAKKRAILMYQSDMQKLREETQKEKPVKVVASRPVEIERKSLSDIEKKAIAQKQKEAFEKLLALPTPKRKVYPRIARVKSIKRPRKDIREERKEVTTKINAGVEDYNRYKLLVKQAYKLTRPLTEKEQRAFCRAFIVSEQRDTYFNSQVGEAYKVAHIIVLQAIKTSLANAKHESAIEKLESLRLQLVTDTEKEYKAPTKDDITYRDTDDLKQVVVIAIMDLFRAGLVKDITQVWSYSWYLYRACNKLIHGEKRLAIQTVSKEQIEKLKIKVNNNVSKVDRKEAINDVWKEIKKHFSKRANARNIKIVFYLSFVKGKTDREVAEKLKTNLKSVYEHKETIRRACKCAYSSEIDMYHALNLTKTCITTYVPKVGHGRTVKGVTLRNTLYHDSYSLKSFSVRKALHNIA